MTARIDDAIARVRAKFLVMLEDRVAVVQACITARTRDAEDLELALFVVHKVAGSAGTLGLPNLGGVAQTCEAQLLRDKQLGGGITLAGYRDLERFVEYAQSVLDTYAARTEQSAPMQRQVHGR